MLLLTAVPFALCADAVLFNVTPKCLYTYRVNPEQSNPDVELPPYTYGYPTNFIAYANTSAPFDEVATFDDVSDVALDDVLVLVDEEVSCAFVWLVVVVPVLGVEEPLDVCEVVVDNKLSNSVIIERVDGSKEIIFVC